jgi:hypothetical protein
MQCERPAEIVLIQASNCDLLEAEYIQVKLMILVHDPGCLILRGSFGLLWMNLGVALIRHQAALQYVRM